MLVANPSKRKLTIAANNDTVLKRDCEKRFSADFRRIFKRMAVDCDAVYSLTGQLIKMEPYYTDVEGALKDNYRRVSGFFKNNIRESLDTDLNARYHTPAVDKQVNHKVLEFVNKNPETQAKKILETTATQMTDALGRIILQAAEAGKDNDRHYIGDELRKWFNSVAPSRATLIAALETNACAEYTKTSEAKVIASVAPTKSAVFAVNEYKVDGSLFGSTARTIITTTRRRGKVGKTWVSHMDEHTRPAHAEMDFVTVDIDEFFIVDGEPMMYPADYEHGASAENLMSCRCSAVYSVADDFFFEAESED